MKTGLEAVKERVKSYAALGRFLGISRGAVAQWDRVPAEHLGKVAQFTGLPHVVIRPDLFTSKSSDEGSAV